MDDGFITFRRKGTNLKQIHFKYRVYISKIKSIKQTKKENTSSLNYIYFIQLDVIELIPCRMGFMCSFKPKIYLIC